MSGQREREKEKEGDRRGSLREKRERGRWKKKKIYGERERWR